MAEAFRSGEKRCKRNHVIPEGRLVCEPCAFLDSGGEVIEGIQHRPVKGKRLEKLGQESFLQNVPAKFIG
jgi:hypothetical protein